MNNKNSYINFINNNNLLTLCQNKELINYVTASRYKMYRHLHSECDKNHEMRMIYFFSKYDNYLGLEYNLFIIYIYNNKNV